MIAVASGTKSFIVSLSHIVRGRSRTTPSDVASSRPAALPAQGPHLQRASALWVPGQLAIYRRTATEALGPRSHLRADASEPIDLDAHDQALLARLAVRVLVHPKESFREFVGVGVGSRLRHRRGAGDTTAVRYGVE